MAPSARPLADGSSWQDADFLNDLLDAIEANPGAIEARHLLAERYLAFHWDEAAVHVAQDILRINPGDERALTVLLRCGQSSEDLPKSKPALPAPGASRLSSPVPEAVKSNAVEGKTCRSNVAKSLISTRVVLNGSASKELTDLRDGYQSLQQEATELLSEITVFRSLAPDYKCSTLISTLEAIIDGRTFSVSRGRTAAAVDVRNHAASTMSQLESARPKTAKELAAAMKLDSSKALEVAIEEFKNFPQSKILPGSSKAADEVLRDAVRKRAEELKQFLPNDLLECAFDAFMHIEHEFLGRTYVNDETMVMGEPIVSIPREQFFASEDGYAWDMSELVQAIKTNGGVMRNPLSKDSFTVSDVEAILRHPLGKDLAALQVEQSRLFQGVRTETVLKLETMAKVLLGDDAEDSRISREAVDDFFTYAATLPGTEKQAIDKLRVPARDSHTGQKYDATIGDALRDAKANRLCFHKAGDLCLQAATHLKQGNVRSS